MPFNHVVTLEVSIGIPFALYNEACMIKLRSCTWIPTTTKGLTHWGRDKMDAISQTTYSSGFSWIKMFEFRLKFQWSLFLRVQIMAWRRPGDKPLSEPMMVSLTTHICVTRPQWVNWYAGAPKIFILRSAFRGQSTHIGSNSSGLRPFINWQSHGREEVWLFILRLFSSRDS